MIKFAIYTDKEGNVKVEQGEFREVQPFGSPVLVGPESGLLYAPNELLDLTQEKLDEAYTEAGTVIQQYTILIERYKALRYKLLDMKDTLPSPTE